MLLRVRYDVCDVGYVVHEGGVYGYVLQPNVLVCGAGWCYLAEISKSSPLLTCKRAENAACCRCTLAATTRLEVVAYLTGRYVCLWYES